MSTTAPTDIAVNLTADSLQPDIQRIVVITLHAYNYGAADASEVLAELRLESGLELQQARATCGHFDLATGAWRITNLAPGKHETLEVHALVQADGDYVAAARICAKDTCDPNWENNWTYIRLRPRRMADLAVVMLDVDPARPDIGQSATLSLEIRNEGPSRATGVVVRLKLPAGFEQVNGSWGAHSYDHASETLMIGDLSAGAEYAFSMKVRVLEGGPYAILARAIANEPPDPNAANNSRTLVVEPKESWEDEAELTSEQRKRIKLERQLHGHFAATLGAARPVRSSRLEGLKIEGKFEYQPAAPLPKRVIED